MKITAAFAGVGLAVGAALFVALRFVVGHSVLDGLGSPVDGLPRRYADYLPVGGSRASDDLRALVVMLVAGLVVGLLIGIAGQVALARRAASARSLRAVLLAGSGLVVGAGLAVGLHLFRGQIWDGSGATFGWSSYSALGSDGVIYGGRSAESWWPLLITGAAVGLVVGAVVALGSHRWFRASTSPSG